MDVSKDGILIKADITHMGDDILISVYGGDRPHIGSCVLNGKSLTISNHKDFIALEVIYRIIKKHTSSNICLVGGIHVKNITKSQIDTVLKLCEELADKIKNKL